jgi:hypothetical protein
MFPGYSHDIQTENDETAKELLHLAILDEDAPLATPALVAHVDGEAVAALSLVDGRSVADPFRRTAHIVTILRLHASAIHAHEKQPSLRERITIQLRRRGVAPAAA